MSKPPNILLLLTDQQRFDTIAALGHSHMVTPSLDRLCAEGVAFTQAHSPNPVCVPARHNILTGLPARFHGYGHNFRHSLPHELPTLPRLLSDGGYVTAAIGKMHFRPARSHHGFQFMRLMEEIPNHVEDDEYLRYLRDNGLGHLQHIHGVRCLGYQQPQRGLVPEAHHGSRWVADETCRFIEANKDRPWFVWSGWIAPHPPVNVPDAFADRYRGAALPPIRGGDDEKPEQRRFRELYYAAITHVDDCLASILQTLDRLDLTRDTLVIFASDHGEMLGDLGLFGKSLPYESSVRIPLILRFPGRIKPGTRREDFADLNDILPTCLDAAGIDINEVARRHHLPAGFPGESLLCRSPRKDRTTQYVEHHKDAGRWCMIRDARWKYVYWYAGGVEELYDMLDDPHETNNMATSDRPEAKTALEHLRGKLIEREAAWGWPGCVENGRLRVFDGRPDLSASGRHPRGAITQWPVFFGKWTEERIRQAEREMMDVVKDEPLGAASRIMCPNAFKESWRKEYLARGGHIEFFDRLFADDLKYLDQKNRTTSV
ncbi:MAG: sulfatase family protein [Phycisphaerales bacterium]